MAVLGEMVPFGLTFDERYQWYRQFNLLIPTRELYVDGE